MGYSRIYTIHKRVVKYTMVVNGVLYARITLVLLFADVEIGDCLR